MNLLQRQRRVPIVEQNSGAHTLTEFSVFFDVVILMKFIHKSRINQVDHDHHNHLMSNRHMYSNELKWQG